MGGFLEVFSELGGHFDELQGRDLCGVSDRLVSACSENY